MVLFWVAVVAGTASSSKNTDPDTLARVGKLATEKVKHSLPEASKIAGPFLAFKPGDVLPIEERVRIRIRTDKQIEGDVTVVPGTQPGEVKLRGIVGNQTQVNRVVELAEGTTGVEKVVNELAIPE